MQGIHKRFKGSLVSMRKRFGISHETNKFYNTKFNIPSGVFRLDIAYKM